jgi:hypothetical protein
VSSNSGPRGHRACGPPLPRRGREVARRGSRVERVEESGPQDGEADPATLSARLRPATCLARGPCLATCCLPARLCRGSWRSITGLAVAGRSRRAPYVPISARCRCRSARCAGPPCRRHRAWCSYCQRRRRGGGGVLRSNSAAQHEAPVRRIVSSTQVGGRRRADDVDVDRAAAYSYGTSAFFNRSPRRLASPPPVPTRGL